VIVVSDSSPLHYLIQIGKADLLRELFGDVVIPRSVQEELSHPAAPAAVRQWLMRPPAWARVLSAAAVNMSLPLGQGEREAICLAQELHADLLLLDDKKARRIAQERGLAVAGTMALLRAAHDRGLVRLPETIRELRAYGFRVSEKLARQVCSDAQRDSGTTEAS
jgi:predicted nucleic acid-binding protein